MPQPPVRKAVFPAAGLGTRFLPVTKAQPKEMLPLVDKPTIQYGVEEAIASGIEQVIMVTGGGKRAIVDHFDRNLELEFYLSDRNKDELLAILAEVDHLSERCDISYIQQKQPLGLGHAVWTARRMVGGEACAVLLADDVIVAEPPCLQQLIDVHLREGATVIATRRVPLHQVSRYGIIAVSASEGTVHQVADLVEKGRVDFQEGWIAPGQLAQIEQAVRSVGAQWLKPLRAALPASISYEDIRLVVAKVRRETAELQQGTVRGTVPRS
jgi:UTP--glucose-1-phosphate uridylyltransferase